MDNVKELEYENKKLKEELAVERDKANKYETLWKRECFCFAELAKKHNDWLEAK